MCGIWACIGAGDATRHIDTLKGRGPEDTRILQLDSATLAFTRLALNGGPNGMQPMQRGPIAWICNGEIYNWSTLAAEYGLTNRSGSDCEILGELYSKMCTMNIPISEFFRVLDGVFALVLVDLQRNRIIVGRDPYGVRPLYTAWDGETRYFGSEVKSLKGLKPEVFLPGNYQVFHGGHRVINEAYHEIPWIKNPMYSHEGVAMEAVRESFIKAVEKRLMTDHEHIAVTLSGGLDSSLVAAVASQLRKDAGKGPIHTFSIGMEGSTDLAYAQKVATWIGSIHTEIVMTPEEFFEAIPAVIRDIESFDTTTVRASVGNWLVAKYIRENSPCKIVLNGDGSDEVWGSYLYFKNAPSDAAFEADVTRLLRDIHYFDVLRSDRSISSHGLEPRTPFLDKQFVAIARSIPTEFRRPGILPEKWLLRRAFEATKWLPYEVLWRKKEAFSDGVSGTEKSWYEITQEMSSAIVGDTWFGKADTAEKYYYKKLHDELYPNVNVPYFWMPRWCNATDPSARTLKVY
jgi:asparagine synthase (glutamine-hydrolysing)